MATVMSASPIRRSAVEAAPDSFSRLGRFAVRRRWWIVAFWALLLLAAIPLAPRVGGALRAGGFILDDLESARAKALLQQELDTPPSAVVVVLHSDATTAGTPAFEAPAAAAIAHVAEAPGVVRILPHTLSPRQVSADGHTAYDIVFLSIPPDDSPEALPGIRERLAQPAGLEVQLAGGPAFYGDVQAVSESDLRRSELVSLPLAAVALLFVFGSVFAAAVPLIVGGAAVVVALAAIFVIAGLTPMSIFVLNLATLLGLGLGVDYSLLLTSRFREELAKRAGDPDDRRVAEAVEATVATAGRAVFFSGLTVLLGLGGLVLFEFMILRSVGIAGAIVVLLAASSALTLLPALLAIVGPRIDALAIRRVEPRDDPNGPWARLARWVMRRPVAVLIPTLALLFALGLPFLHVRFNAPDSTILPASVPSRAAFDRLADAFGEGEFAPIVLAIRTDGPATSPANVAALYDYSRRLAADPRIRRVDSLVDVDPRLQKAQYQLLYADPNGPRDRFVATALATTTRGDLTAFTITTPYGPNRDEGRSLVTDLRAGGALAPPAGMTVLVGGGAADVADVVGRVAADFPRTGLFIVVTTWIVLFLLLRSVVLPIKALVMNTLSIVASFGALVWIFQDGNLSGPLGFQPLGFVETTQPVILFCVLFGLSMDYEVFLLSRMKEVWDRTGDNQEAVARGLERSGRIVTSAALIVVVVAGSFAFADIVLIKALGIGMAIAVALDATVVRALLVPATMRLLGRWNWWLPAGLRRVPRIETAGVAGIVALALVAVPLLAGCTAGSPILANPAAPHPPPPAVTPAPSVPTDPIPIVLPADDAPHHRLTEWWYDTGHLRTADGHRYGFEFVVFRAERGGFPVSWASHLAITDETAGTFRFAQRTEIGPQVDRSPAAGFDLSVAGGAAPGSAPSVGTTAVGPPWTMTGGDGHDHLVASSDADGASPTTGSLGLDLNLAATKPPALHDTIGWIDFAEGGSSYYYSRTAMTATGSVTIDGVTQAVTGEAWFDHQWGDFITVGGGGWDWFAVNLSDGTDLTLSLVRNADGSYPLVYGTLVAADGTTRHLPADAFRVDVTKRWQSPATGADYPAGWRVTLPGEDLTIDLSPTVADQELDTRASTGVVYWEGSQHVSAQRAGRPLGGEAYVELTGYAPAR